MCARLATNLSAFALVTGPWYGWVQSPSSEQETEAQSRV